MAQLRHQCRLALAPHDLALAVHGPWHPGAGIDGDRPLHHPRTRTARLQDVWRAHRPAIERAAAEAGVAQPWIASRLAFVAMLHRTDG